MMEQETTLQLLKYIVPAAQNNISTKFIVLDKGIVVLEGQKKTCLALVADETASLHFQFWGDECDAFEGGDILILVNGIFSYSRNNLVLRAGKRGKVEKVGDFTMAYVETPNMSEIRWVPCPNDPKRYVQQAIISSHSHLFPPPPFPFVPSTTLNNVVPLYPFFHMRIHHMTLCMWLVSC